MIQQLRIASVILFALTVVTGGIYPAVVTAIAQLAYPRQANGSLIHDAQRTVGSALVGQPFTKPEYFWGRLSATSPVPYNAAASSGSNYGPLHPALRAAAQARIAALQSTGQPATKSPVDLVTASGSGLDPHISPEAARYQVARVASARQMDPAAVQQLVEACIEGRQLGLLGQPRVNVLQLNQALDRDEPEAPAK